jgi:hypothetical protein
VDVVKLCGQTLSKVVTQSPSKGREMEPSFHQNTFSLKLVCSLHRVHKMDAE